MSERTALWEPSLESLTPRELSERVEKPRLAEQLAYVIGKSSFYREKLKDFIARKDIFSYFPDLPFTEKQEVVDDQLQSPPFGSNLCVEPERVLRVHRTSGTTAKPVVIALTRKDIDAAVSSGSRCFWASGLRPGDVVFHCLNYCLWMGGFTDHQSLEGTGAAVVPFGVGNSKALIESILSIKPTAIHCTPSYLSKLETVLETEFRLSPRELGIKKGLFAGEGGLQNDVFRKRIEDVWGLKAMNANYGVSDALSMFGAECLDQQGLHFMGQGNILVEMIAPETGKSLPIEKGTAGEFVLTNLRREAQPLIRFRTHDIVEILDHDRCSCARRSFRFKVLGRSDDMLVVKGVNVYPGAIRDIIAEFFEHVSGEFQIVAAERRPLETITLRVEHRDSLAEGDIARVRRSLEERIKVKTDISSLVELIPRGTLPRTEGKTKRIVAEGKAS